MKKITVFFAVVLLLTTLTGCVLQDTVTDFPIADAMDEIADTYGISGGTRYSSRGGGLPTLDEDLVRAYYGDAADIPDFSKVEAYEVYIDETKPTIPCEYAIFKLSDASYCETFKKYLEARIALKLANAKMYPSMQTSMLKSAKFTVRGNYVWYCAVKEQNERIDSFLSAKTKGE